MKRILIFLMVVASTLGFAISPAKAAEGDWWWSTSKQPNCDLMAGVGISVKGSSYIQITQGFSDCDLMIRDALYGPRMQIVVLDVDYDYGVSKSSVGAHYQYNPPQNIVEASYHRSFFCVQGHRISVDLYWTSWGDRTPPGARKTVGWGTLGNLGKRTVKIVCGSNVRWN